MQLRRLILPAAVLAVAAALQADEGSPSVRRYKLGRHGELQLTVPQSWSDRVGRTYINAPPTVEFSSRHDRTFTLKVRPGWSDTQNPDFTNPEVVRATVEKWATGGQRQSAGPTLPLLELTGPGIRGYLYRFLDKDPNPEALRYWTIGLVITGDLVLYAEVHASGPSSSAEQRTLELLKSARHLKGAGKD
jgi:hypothetical protein